jgi:hypothetical protein
MRKRTFNEGYYSTSIQRWERETVPGRIWFSILQWGVLITLLGGSMGARIAGHDWALAFTIPSIRLTPSPPLVGCSGC